MIWCLKKKIVNLKRINVILQYHHLVTTVVITWFTYEYIIFSIARHLYCTVCVASLLCLIPTEYDHVRMTCMCVKYTTKQLPHMHRRVARPNPLCIIPWTQVDSRRQDCWRRSRHQVAVISAAIAHLCLNCLHAREENGGLCLHVSLCKYPETMCIISHCVFLQFEKFHERTRARDSSSNNLLASVFRKSFWGVCWGRCFGVMVVAVAAIPSHIFTSAPLTITFTFTYRIFENMYDRFQVSYSFGDDDIDCAFRPTKETVPWVKSARRQSERLNVDERLTWISARQRTLSASAAVR